MSSEKAKTKFRSNGEDLDIPKILTPETLEADLRDSLSQPPGQILFSSDRGDTLRADGGLLDLFTTRRYFEIAAQQVAPGGEVSLYGEPHIGPAGPDGTRHVTEVLGVGDMLVTIDDTVKAADPTAPVDQVSSLSRTERLVITTGEPGARTAVSA